MCVWGGGGNQESNFLSLFGNFFLLLCIALNGAILFQFSLGSLDGVDFHNLCLNLVCL